MSIHKVLKHVFSRPPVTTAKCLRQCHFRSFVAAQRGLGMSKILTSWIETTMTSHSPSRIIW